MAFGVAARHPRVVRFCGRHLLVSLCVVIAAWRLCSDSGRHRRPAQGVTKRPACGGRHRLAPRWWTGRSSSRQQRPPAAFLVAPQETLQAGTEARARLRAADLWRERARPGEGSAVHRRPHPGIIRTWRLEVDPAQESTALTSFENRHAAEHMLASLGRGLRTKARKGQVSAFVVSANKDGSLNLTQARVLAGGDAGAALIRVSLAWPAGFLGLGRRRTPTISPA